VIQFTTLVSRASLTSGELIRACIEGGDEAVWEEFVRRFRPAIVITVSRTARRFGEWTPQLVDDLSQETFLKLCANRCRILREFTPRAEESIVGLLKSVAFSVTHDHFRSAMAVMRGAGRKESVLDPYLESTVAGRDGLPEIEREILMKEIDSFLSGSTKPEIAERDRQIFWLYYRQGMTTAAIAAVSHLGLTPKGVESVIQRLTSLVRQRLIESRAKNTEGKPSTNTL
jgi:RNA polymerase sigma factor (sigma-70 family)